MIFHQKPPPPMLTQGREIQLIKSALRKEKWKILMKEKNVKVENLCKI
jgi:hypothetical protein